MSFAIEVPGDANPLTAQDLARALEASISADFAQRQTAGEQLKTWENQYGYYSLLQSVFLERSLAYNIRYQAIIQFKNGVDKHWRLAATTKGGIQDQEKESIRRNLLVGSLEEENDQLALHNALAAAKIIRIDYPRNWPDILPSMVQEMGKARRPGGNPAHVRGYLLVWLHVVKELSSARLRTSQTALQSNAPEIAYELMDTYVSLVPVWEGALTGQNQDANASNMAIFNTLTSLKTLRRLLISGFQAPHKDKTVQEFWSISQQHLGRFLKYIGKDAPPCPWPEKLRKHVVQFTKFHVSMASDRPASFAALPGCLDLVDAYWKELVLPFSEGFGHDDGTRLAASSTGAAAEKPLPEKLATRALLLIKACLDLAYLPKQTFAYRGQEAKEEEKQAVDFIKTKMFTDDFAARVASTILTKLFVFRQTDMEAWEEDPEGWEQQQKFDSTAYEIEARPCAEKVFLSLLLNKKDLLLPNLLAYIETAATPDADFNTKDAVYTAMGLASMHLVDRFDFNVFLASTLVQDAQRADHYSKVLRRRIACLLGQWVYTNMTDESRATIYQMFRHFLNANDEHNDTVVQLSAARNLQSVVEELDFNPELFAPYAADILQALTKLAQESESEETKLTILETIRLVVTRLESHVEPLGDYIMSTVATTFGGVGSEDFMVKIAIVGIFNALVTSMETRSQRYHPMMVPLISETAQPTSDLHLSLIDEVLDLWNSILGNSNPPVAPEIVNLAPLALPILTYGSETAGQALDAVESYIMLAPEAVLGDHLRRPFVEALADMVEVRSREQARKASQCLEYLIRAAFDLGKSQGISIIVQDLLAVGFVPKVFEGLHDAWQARQTTGPKRRVAKLTASSEGDFFAILARVALADPAIFIDMIQTMGPIEQVWPWLMSEWFAHMEGWDYVEHKKLAILALARLLELQQPVQNLFLGRLQEFLTLWTGTVAELQDGVANAADNQVWHEYEGTEYDNQKSIRERTLAMEDPVHRVVAKHFVRDRLQSLIDRVGEQAFQQEWLQNVDADVVQKFSQFIMSD